MNNISIELAKLDIKVRDYLNVKRYYKSPRYIIEEVSLIQKKIPYFWLNASTIVTGYIIETIDGEVYKPVIGIKQLSLKQRLHYQLKNKILNKIRKKYLFNLICCLSTKTNLPQDLIKYLLEWTDLISQSKIDQ